MPRPHKATMAFAVSGIKAAMLTGLSLPILAQAPMLQDGAMALRQARLDWTLGQAPMGPSSMPSFEAGWGGAGSEGAYVPLTHGEGLGPGTGGWGLGLQGRFVKGAWSFSATVLGLRDHGRTTGILHRAAIAYQTESGWRAALEQAPFAWGSGLNGGELLGDGARSFPRFSLSTPEGKWPMGRWHVEAFAGRLDGGRPIPDWISDREARQSAQAVGLDLQKPLLWGGLVRASFGTLVEASLGALRLEGGQDIKGFPAPSSAARSTSMAELRLRLPALARFAHARGASVHASRSAAPESRTFTLSPARHLGGLQLVWEGWDLGLEYAGGAQTAVTSLDQPGHLAGFSSRGDALGPAFGRAAITRTVELGLPLFLEGQGRLKVVRSSIRLDVPSGTHSWFMQAEAQWRTPTGKVGASLASRRDELSGAQPRWGWSFMGFQSFRVF